MIIRVVDGEGPSLMCRDIISQFQLPWEDLLEEYSDLFEDSKVGKIEGVKIKLHADERAKPVFKALSLKNEIQRKFSQVRRTRYRKSKW